MQSGEARERSAINMDSTQPRRAEASALELSVVALLIAHYLLEWLLVLPFRSFVRTTGMAIQRIAHFEEAQRQSEIEKKRESARARSAS